MRSSECGLQTKSASSKKRTQGETQTPNGVWVSPAPERERERKKKKRRRRTYQTAKERERGHQTPKRTRGQVLKGTRPNSISTPKTKKNHTKNQTTIPKAPNKRPLTNQTESQRNCRSRVEGPMGRPALLGSHPRGPQYRGVQVPPHYGSWHSSRHKTDTPKACPGA